MMCTCCAAPVVVGLRKANASSGAAISFWLGNSVLNPATLVFIGFVLGWRWSALRLLLGTAAVLGLGLMANRMSSPRRRRPQNGCWRTFGKSRWGPIRSHDGWPYSPGWRYG